MWWAHLNSHALMRLQLGFPWGYLEWGITSFYQSFQTGQYVCRVVYLQHIFPCLQETYTEVKHCTKAGC